MMRVLVRDKVVLAGAVIFFLLAGAALFAPLVAPFPPGEIAPVRRLAPPSLAHFFGTDHLGRDIFSRVVFGARTSLMVGLVVVIASGIVGAVLGLLAGYYSRLDNVVMRLMDGLMAFPGVLLAIALMAVFGAGTSNIMIALAVVYMPRVARVARAAVLVIREQPFVEAARALGGSDGRIMFLHIAPNTWGPVYVQCTFIFAYAVLAEAALSFLGVGASPGIPTWGNVLSEGRSYLTLAPWITFFPGIAIMLAVLSLNLLGEGLRDLLDPRLRDSGDSYG